MATPAPTAVPVHVRSLAELVNTAEPGMPLVREWAAKATNPVEILPLPDRHAGERALLAIQVTSRSPMGAIALETGGILIDHGWIRVLGAGSPRLPRSIGAWNGMSPEHPAPPSRLPGAFLVGDDVLGGFFAVNGGGLDGPPGHVFYFAPDTLEWEDIAPSYSDWLTDLLFAGALDRFYEGQRWPGWEKEVARLPGDRAYSIYPFLWAKGEPVATRSRRAVPVAELWDLGLDMRRQIKARS